MKNIASITSRCDDSSLVILDELGSGTDPEEGAALSRAVLKYFSEHAALTCITSHYSAVKSYAYSENGMMNASMEFDPSTFAPTYKLIIGVPGSSNAIEIASRLGLDKKITEAARSKLSEEKISFENVLEYISCLIFA